MPIKEIGRKHGSSDASFYKWCAKYAGMDASEAKRLRELELENSKLKRLLATLALNQTWSMDCVSDVIARPGAVSRRIKCLTVADDFSHECVDITADFGIGDAYVTRLLDRAATFRGLALMAAVEATQMPKFHLAV